jgi:hypothetical protein
MVNEYQSKIVDPDHERGAAAEPRIAKPEPDTSNDPTPPVSTKNDNESGESNE